MQKISAYIIAYNEAEKIADAVSSVLWADEIIVADSGSTDRTAEIAQSLGARVVQIPFEGFGELRNRTLAELSHDWVFSLDSDERCTREVRDEILAILASNPPHDAYLVPRRNYMMGRWIKGSGWYPNFRQPQLFRKSAMRYDTDPVHEGYVLLTDKPLGQLQNAIWQFPFRNLAEIISKMNRYSTLGRAQARGQAGVDGRRARPWPVGVRQALRVQARLPRRLGRLRDRARKFRGHVLPLRQALRGDAVLVATAERAAAAAVEAFHPLTRSKRLSSASGRHHPSFLRTMAPKILE